MHVHVHYIYLHAGGCRHDGSGVAKYIGKEMNLSFDFPYPLSPDLLSASKYALKFHVVGGLVCT